MLETTAATVSTTFEWTDFDAPSTAIVTAVAEEAGAEPMDLDPLFRVIDPDGLDCLLSPTDGSQTPHSVGVEFEYQGFYIVVKANGMGYLYEQNSVSSATEGA